MKTILRAIKAEQRRRRRGDRETEGEGGGGGGKAVRGETEREEKGGNGESNIVNMSKKALICLKLTNSILEIRWSDFATPLALLPPPSHPHLHHLRAELSKSLIRLLIARPCKEGDINTVEGWGEGKMSGRRRKVAKQRGSKAARKKRGEGE